MFKLIQKNRRAVSPVIAVILLIALTVATVAIIWGVILPLLSQGTVAVRITTTSATIDSSNNAVWKGIINVSGDGSFTASITLDNGTVLTPTYSTQSLSSGDNSVTLTFAALTAGSYTIDFSFTPSGSSAATIQSVDVTFA